MRTDIWFKRKKILIGDSVKAIESKLWGDWGSLVQQCKMLLSSIKLCLDFVLWKGKFSSLPKYLPIISHLFCFPSTIPSHNSRTKHWIKKTERLVFMTGTGYWVSGNRPWDSRFIPRQGTGSREAVLFASNGREKEVLARGKRRRRVWRRLGCFGETSSRLVGPPDS